MTATKYTPANERNRARFVSVIVPTLNHARSLQTALESILVQDFPAAGYEILVVDNGSTDDTRAVAEKAIAKNPGHSIHYIFEPIPGLLSGRHRGTKEAVGDILVFVDDDIEAAPGWLSGIATAFKDPSVHLVGGPSRPRYEVDPPRWMTRYLNDRKGRITCGSLSLFDIGDQTAAIDPTFVWGLNFSIRKATLLDLKGFHPDGVPKNLLHLRGDGETGLSLKMRARRLGALYTGTATVYHHIPKERLTVGYFERRHFAQGISDSYTQIRKNGGVHNMQLPGQPPEGGPERGTSLYAQYAEMVHRRISGAYADGFRFHYETVKASRQLLKWVLKADYYEYSLPDLHGLTGTSGA